MRKHFLPAAAIAFTLAISALSGCQFKSSDSNVRNTQESSKIYEAEVECMERDVINFNTKWLYSPADYKNAASPEFDDSGFEAVALPHANTLLAEHKDPGFAEQIESYRFVSWYRRHFSLDKKYSGKRVFLEFEGVATVAEVYVNGKQVCTHKGAYTGFKADITDYLNEGNNVLAVRVDSERQPDIPPEGGSVDYCLFGGIVRDVRMIITAPAYIDDVFITTPELSADSGKTDAVVSVKNCFADEKILTVTSTILDAEGNTVAVMSDEKTVRPADTVEFRAISEEISSPKLWSTDNPYLYTVRTTLSDGENVIDSVVSRLGFRWFSFEDDGLYLNGEKIKIVGVNRHEQWPWIGRAVPNRQQQADADLIKDTGFNAVRCSHYPQDPSFLERCDEIGLIVFEEAPGWQFIGGEEWQEVYKENIREMILRDRNHPSILSWGTRVNESFDCDDLYTETNRIAKELDSTRPTHGVRRMESYENSNFLENEDIFCVNYTYPDFPRHRPFIITEHSMDWFSGHGFPSASDSDALLFANSFAESVNYYFGNDLCLGGFAWSMFDYNNEVNYTDTDNLFYSGLYSIFRIPKMASYFYRSQKNPEDGAMVYIANYRTSGSPSDVTIYSNCEEVELFAGKKSLGKIKPDVYPNLPHPVFVFKDVPAEENLRAVGYIGGKKAAEHTAEIPGEAAEIILKPQFSALTADGSDFTSVEIYAVDKNGTLVPYADNKVKISVSGEGKFIGEEEITLEGGSAAFLVQSLYNKPGKVTAEVTADGLKSASCEITVEDFTDKTIAAPNSTGTEKPVSLKTIDINDSDTNVFEYSGRDWQSCSQGGCYFNDNHYSKNSGDTVTFKFTGDEFVWYGTTAPNHGIMTVSVDGEETEIDCYSAERRDSVILYSSGILPAGEHTVTVTVTGRKNENSTDAFINVDRIRMILAGE